MYLLKLFGVYIYKCPNDTLFFQDAFMTITRQNQIKQLGKKRAKFISSINLLQRLHSFFPQENRRKGIKLKDR